MISGVGKVTTKDNTAKLAALLKDISQMEVYVGVPEEKAGRKAGTVNNAQLVFLHTNGSPLRKIPKRPIIEPAIEADGNKQPIAHELSLAAKAALDGKKGEAKQHLRTAGMIGQNASRAWFTDSRNGWPDNRPLTIARKLAKMRGSKGKAARLAYSKGETSFTWKDQSYGVNTILVDTGQMKKAIVYVVKGEA